MGVWQEKNDIWIKKCDYVRFWLNMGSWSKKWDLNKKWDFDKKNEIWINKSWDCSDIFW